MIGPYPFEQVLVVFDPQGVTAVTWRLSPRLRDPAPYRFLLQFVASAAPGEADWEDVGVEAEDAAFLSDSGGPRLSGQTPEAYYRVVLTTGAGRYASNPAGCLSALDYRDWRVSRSILQQERKRSRLSAVDGYLLKERRYGPPCPVCVDPATGSVTDSHCPRCYGVGVDGGYMPAAPIVWDLGLDAQEEFQDNQSRGTAKETAVQGRFAGQPSLNSRDLVVERRAGRRWNVGRIDQGAAVKGYVLVETAELRPLPYTDVAYQVPLHA